MHGKCARCTTTSWAARLIIRSRKRCEKLLTPGSKLAIELTLVSASFPLLGAVRYLARSRSVRNSRPRVGTSRRSPTCIGWRKGWSVVVIDGQMPCDVARTGCHLNAPCPDKTRDVAGSWRGCDGCCATTSRRRALLFRASLLHIPDDDDLGLVRQVIGIFCNWLSGNPVAGQW